MLSTHTKNRKTFLKNEKTEKLQKQATNIENSDMNNRKQVKNINNVRTNNMKLK
jgi:hypothetical protein